MKKKALRWWVWLIPVGLICVIGLGVLLYRSANRKTPQELCRDALRDALEEAVGYREPLMKAMHAEDLAGYLKDSPTDVGLSLQIQNSDMTLADFGFGNAENSPALADYRGMGLTFITSYDGQAVSVDTRFAVSALSLSVIQMRYASGELRLASPKIIKEVLTLPVGDAAEQWRQSSAWELLPEASREGAQNAVGEGIEYGRKALAIGKNVRDAIISAYPGGESALDRLVDAISYEQLKDKDGKELTERIVVGSEKVPCYVFRINLDEEVFYDIADRIADALGIRHETEADKRTWRLTPQPDGGNGLEILAYVTKEGELAQMTAEVVGLVSERQAHFTMKLRCMGSEDPQDKLLLNINGEIDGEEYELSAKKTVKADRSRVSSMFEISVKLPHMDQYGLSGSASYNIGGGLLQVSVNAQRQGKAIGTMDLSAECNYKNSWDMKISELTFRDRESEKFVTFYGQLSVGPSRDGVLDPDGEKVSLLTLTKEKAQEIMDEAVNQINWYYRQFFR